MSTYHLTPKVKVCSLAPARRRSIGLTLVILILCQTFIPGVALALTSGPSQPEYQQFQPVGATDMVDLFSGNFSYNLPLFELPGPNGGYPFNLSYQSGVSMDQEASWVGLGWSLNVGAVNRMVRGLPDDFNGDQFKEKTYMKPEVDVTVTTTVNSEFAGFKKLTEATEEDAFKINLSFGRSLSYNSYTGWSRNTSLGVSSPLGKKLPFKAGFTTAYNTREGGSLSATLSPTEDFRLKNSFSNFIGSLSSSIQLKEGAGIQSFGFNSSINAGLNTKPKQGRASKSIGANFSPGATWALPARTFNPSISYSQSSVGGAVGFMGGGEVNFLSLGGGTFADFSTSSIEDNGKIISRRAFGYLNLIDRNSSGYFFYDNNGNPMYESTEDAVMDYNPVTPAILREDMTVLEPGYTTPDVYSINGQGINSSYVPLRRDLGVASPESKQTNSFNAKISGEAHVGDVIKIGVDVGFSDFFSQSGNWGALSNGDLIVGADDFLGWQSLEGLPNNRTNRNWDFIAGGCKTAAIGLLQGKDGLFNFIPEALSNQNPAPRLEKTGSILKTAFRSSGQLSSVVLRDFTDATEQLEELLHENKPLLTLTNRQIREGQDIFHPLLDISYGDAQNGETLAYDRTDQPDDHIGALIATQESGMRYVYGLPVINKEQISASYDLNGGSVSASSCAKIDVPTSGGSDWKSQIQGSGKREYSSIKETPAHATDFLLTAVVGPDYVDVNGNGPDEGDYGYWVKFSYSKTDDDFSYRAPYLGANHIRGRFNDPQDDRASFLYGEREQYYLATAETKTHLAKFETSPNVGFGFGAKNPLQNLSPNGDVSSKTYKLDNVSLFTKLELENAISDGRLPVPLKKAVFDYDDSLCENVENSIGGSRGKLTLKEVRFLYQNSSNGDRFPYKFSYEQQHDISVVTEGTRLSTSETKYDAYAYDRWGMADPRVLNGLRSSCDAEEYPYPAQRATDAGAELTNTKAATMWALTGIQMPSGSRLRIGYERDDYAYVQDRAATIMVPIHSLVHNDVPSNHGLDGVPIDKDPSDNDLRVYFDVPSDIKEMDTDKRESYLQRYLKDLHVGAEDGSQVLFSIESRLTEFPSSDQYERIQGYSSVEFIGYDEGASSSIDDDRAYAQLKGVNVSRSSTKKYYHPFAVAAWQVLKTEFPWVKDKSSNLSSFATLGSTFNIRNIARAASSVVRNFRSFYSIMSQEEFGDVIDLSNSYIRLNDPLGKKYGGGSRVKFITVDDRWDDSNAKPISGIDDPDLFNTFGQVYEYNTHENGFEISSGVAQNEPNIGFEACALLYADFYDEEARHRSVNKHYVEYPLNRAYYPGASVGYSKVSVTPLATYLLREGLLPGNTPIYPDGVTIHEFYTAKDFPVIQEEGPLSKEVLASPGIPTPFGTKQIQSFAGSQGHRIELNDMHGQARKVSTYPSLPNGELDLAAIPTSSSTNYFHTSDARISQGKSSSGARLVQRINNDFAVLPRAGSTRRNHGIINSSPAALLPQGGPGSSEFTSSTSTAGAELGVVYETVLSGSQSSSDFFNAGLQANSHAFILLFGAVVPIIIPSASRSRSFNGVAITNTIVRRHGFLDSVVTTNGTARITQANHVYDAETGRAVITSSTDEFGNRIYNQAYTADQIYDRAGQASLNQGTEFYGQIRKVYGSNESTCTIDLTPYEMDPSGITNVMSDDDIDDLFSEGDELVLLSGLDFETVLIGGIPIGSFGPVDVTGSRRYIVNRISGSSDKKLVLEHEANSTDYEHPQFGRFIIFKSGRTNQLGLPAQNYTSLDDNWNRANNFFVNEDIPYPDQNGNTLSTNISATDEGVLNSVLSASANKYTDHKHSLGATPTLETECGCDGVKLFFSTSPLDIGTVTPLSSRSGSDPGPDGSECSNIDNTQLSFAGPAVGGYVYEELSVTGELGHSDPIDIDLNSILQSDGFGVWIDLEIKCSDRNVPRVSVTSFPEPDAPGGGYYVYQGLMPDGSYECWDIVYVNYGNNLTISTEECIESVRDETVTGLGKFASFLKGERGAFRVGQQFVHRGDRVLSGGVEGNGGQLDVSSDGLIPNVGFFGHSKLVQTSDWIETGQSLTYDRDGNPIYSADAIGNSSAALYGYKNSLAIASASNASHTEVAFCSFEGRNADGTSLPGNFNTATGSRSPRIPVSGAIIGVTNPSNSTAVVEFPKGVSAPLGAVFEGALELVGDNGEIINLEISSASIETLSSSLLARVPVHLRERSRLLRYTVDECQEIPNGLFSGAAHIYYTGELTAIGSGVEISSHRSHSGEYSLKFDVDGTYQAVQHGWWLDPARRYVVSAWVQSFAYRPGGEYPVELEVQGATVHDVNWTAPIDGWRRVELTFSGVAATPTFIIRNNLPSNDPYVDDIRLQPEDGSLVGFVYEEDTYRLSAKLDENNFATYYDYDEEGRLSATRIETLEGVKTLSEQRQFRSPNATQ